MGKLTSEKGKLIREEYSTTKEKNVCDQIGLTQIKGIKTKVDGTNGVENVSIKNFTGKSTQVHLTTQKRFIEVMKLDNDSINFINMFCGSESINNIYVESFLKFLNENKIKVVDLIVNNGYNITSIVYKDLKNDNLSEITYDDIIRKIEQCSWVALKGGIHLKNNENKTYFHFQREGKKNKNNRYNVLWHIHDNLFV
jgi:hypothetical protein